MATWYLLQPPLLCQCYPLRAIYTLLCASLKLIKRTVLPIPAIDEPAEVSSLIGAHQHLCNWKRKKNKVPLHCLVTGIV